MIFGRAPAGRAIRSKSAITLAIALRAFHYYPSRKKKNATREGTNIFFKSEMV